MLKPRTSKSTTMLNSSQWLDMESYMDMENMDMMGGNFSGFPVNWTGGIPPGMKRYETLRIVVWFLYIYFIPILIVAGFLGNGLSMMVFLCTYLKRLSLSVYLAALAASDSVFLLTLCMMWLDYVDVHVIQTNGICQTVLYLGYVSSFLSVWFVVCFTVERYIAICHPLKRPEMCTTSRAKKVVLALTLVSLVGYSCSLWTSGIETIGLSKVCTPLKDYLSMNAVLKYADIVVSLIIPFLLIVVLNIIIAYKIAYFYKRRQSMQNAAYYRRPAYSQEPSLYSRAQLKVTKMLLLLSSMFLLINLPFYAMRLRLFLMSFIDQGPNYVPNTEVFVQSLLQIIYYTNFSINFVVYSVFSTKFRDAFKRFWWQLKFKTMRFIALGIYRVFRRNDSSTASGEQEIPAGLPLGHHYGMNTKFYV